MKGHKHEHRLYGCSYCMSPSTVPYTQSSTVEERGEVMKWYNQLVEIPLEQGVGLVHATRRGDGPCNNPGQHSLTLNMFSLLLHPATFCSASYYILHTHSSNSVSSTFHQVQPKVSMCVCVCYARVRFLLFTLKLAVAAGGAEGQVIAGLMAPVLQFVESYPSISAFSFVDNCSHQLPVFTRLDSLLSHV